MFFILTVLVIVPTTSSQVIFTTVPSTNNGPAYVFADEGTLNVSLYCEVISQNIQVLTRWFVRRQTDNMILITDFNAAGELTSPNELLGTITAIGYVIPDSQLNLTYETNFTILNFTSEFDLAQIQCGPNDGLTRTFSLGLAGMINCFYVLFLLCFHSSSISINSC